MQVDKFNTNRICVPGPLGVHPLLVPNLVIPPGSADFYRSYMGMTSVAGYQTGAAVIGMNPDSPFALHCVPGTVNLVNASITKHIGFYSSSGVTMALGGAFKSLAVLSNLTGVLQKIVGTSVVSSSIAPGLDARAGILTGVWTINGLPIEDKAHGHSDIRLKRTIIPIEGALDKVTKLNGISFRWDRDYAKKTRRDKELKTKVVTRSIGFIAQDVEKVVPEVVSTDKIDGIDFDVKKVDYEKMVALLTEAIKEQQTQIESLKGEVQELKSQLNN
jgi:hypothetical protein